MTTIGISLGSLSGMRAHIARLLLAGLAAVTVAGAQDSAVTIAAVAPLAADSVTVADTGADSTPDTTLSQSAYSPLVDTGSFFAETEQDQGRSRGPRVVTVKRDVKPGAARLWLAGAWRLLGAVFSIGPFRWLARYALQLIVLFVSAGAIWYAAGYFYAHRDSERFLSSDRLSLMDKEVQKACVLVEDNYADLLLSPQGLCEKLVTGESFLESLFQRELGMGVWDYIEHVRINRAIQLMRRETSLVDLEVATMTGFATVEDFDYSFTKVTKMSASTYREALAAGEDPLA